MPIPAVHLRSTDHHRPDIDLLNCNRTVAQELFSALPINCMKRIRLKRRSLAERETLKQFRAVPNTLKKYMTMTAEDISDILNRD